MRKLVRRTALMLCLLILVGCGCRHEWMEADCRNPAACVNCGKTNGESLGHTPGDWVQTSDVIAAQTLRKRSCQVCGEQTDREMLTMDTMVQEGMFLFSPAEFMERLASVVGQYGNTLDWEFSYSDVGLQAMVTFEATESLVQFFHADTTALDSEEEDARVVWCVNLSQINEADPELRRYFLMACDPMLDSDTVENTNRKLLEAMEKAEGSFGYHEENGLLYEVFFVEENLFGQNYSLNMLNIYASDFR